MSINGWTTERREHQAALIKNWQPWKHSTGPMSQKGKAISAQNAFKGYGWRQTRREIVQLNQLIKNCKKNLGEYSL